MAVEDDTLTGVVIGPDDVRKFQVVQFPADDDELVRAIVNELNAPFDVLQSDRLFELGQTGSATGFFSDTGRADKLTQNVLATQVLRPNGNWTLLGTVVILGRGSRGLNTDLNQHWIDRVRQEARELGWMGIPSS